MRLPASPLAPLLAVALLGGCAVGPANGGGAQALSAAALRGPAADYPVVLGEPFTIGPITYTPADRKGYDNVGFASLGEREGFSAAHKTLPLPSYVEVTSLETGKTVLVRVEQRGPMTNDRLIELSSAASAQLGLTSNGAPVRVRRANPPEAERALLRAGQPASARMDTPKALLAVLMRKLEGPDAAAAVAPQAEPGASSESTPARASDLAPEVKPRPARGPVSARAGQFVVQAGAFSDRARADRVAAVVGGRVETSGKLFRVRIGPFVDRSVAEAALAKARAAGYSEARILRAG